MNKFKKVIFITIFLLILCSYYVVSNASSLTDLITNSMNNNNQTNNTSVTNNTVNNDDNDITDDIISDNPVTPQPEQETSVFSNLPEAQLGLGNILNILLIVVGVLIILLAIAILIRMKKY